MNDLSKKDQQELDKLLTDIQDFAVEKDVNILDIL